MTTNNGDMPASAIIDDEISTHDKEIHFGLTKREHFAAMALQGICVNVGRNQFAFNKAGDIGNKAVEMADALLKALSEDSSNE